MTTIDRMDLALLGTADMAAADRTTIGAGTSGLALMENAGRAVADAACRRCPPGGRVLVLCGPGQNGGDGFVVARLLKQRGVPVALALAGARDALHGDAAAMAGRWMGEIVPLAGVRLQDHALVVDALFGAGLNRPLSGEAAAIVERVNATGLPVIAIDVPSGLSGDSGRAEGAVIRATETVTFFRLKPGHLLYPGRGLCGLVTLAQIGIDPDVVFGPGGLRPCRFRNAPALWGEAWPAHAVDTHKYKRGAVLVLAGGIEGVGAPRLSARASLRIGAGLATIACRPEALAAHAGRGPDALMQRAISSTVQRDALLAEPRLGAIVAGPALGLDAQARDLVRAVVRADAPAVLDADALTLLAIRPEALARAAGRRRGDLVLTPHEGEFARLFGSISVVAEAGSKLERARAAAAFSGAVVVLKGVDSVIAAPDGRAAINTTGSAALATAGAGDVLAGMIGGLLAQGMAGFEAACAAVWLHGKAGETLGEGLIADDLPEALPEVVREMRAGLA